MGTKSLVADQVSIIPEYLARNREVVGQYFSRLLNDGLKEWEWWALGMLIRSNAYEKNDIRKLLELANDMSKAYTGQIKFVDKYVGDLFDRRASKVDREIAAFLNKKVILSLKRIIEGREA